MRFGTEIRLGLRRAPRLRQARRLFAADFFDATLLTVPFFVATFFASPFFLRVNFFAEGSRAGLSACAARRYASRSSPKSSLTFAEMVGSTRSAKPESSATMWPPVEVAFF